MHTRALRPVVVVAIAVLCVLVARQASAQDERWNWTPQFGPNIVASAGAVAPADVGDSGQRYRFRVAGLGVAVPIAGGWDWDGQDISGFRLMVHGGFHLTAATIPYSTDQQDLFAMEAGVSAMHILGRDNQIIWSAGVAMAEATSASSSPKPRLVGRVIAVHKCSETLTLLYGGAYAFITGKGRAIPVFGVLWRPRPGTTITAIGPLVGRVHQQIGSHLMVGAQVGLRGNQYRIGSNARFSSPTDELHLRVREVRIGGEAGLVVGRSLALFGEAGVATARTVMFADGKTELFSATAATQPYFTVSLRVSFKKTGRWD